MFNIFYRNLTSAQMSINNRTVKKHTLNTAIKKNDV